MRLRDTTGETPLRRMTVAVGRLDLPPGVSTDPLPVHVSSAGHAAFLAAAKGAARLIPTAAVPHITDAFCELAPDASGVTATATVQGYARETLETVTLAATAAALLALRDALGASGAHGKLRSIEVVQSVVN